MDNQKRESFITIKNSGKGELIERKSRFIAYASPVENDEEATAFIDQVKAENKDATHHVYAYIAGDQNQYQRSNDDGEPSGTAGRPVLEAIKKAELKNTAIVVVRYFGGVLLGSGGLTRAYGKVANLVLNEVGKVKKIPAEIYSLCFDYSLLGKIEAFLSTNNYPVINKIYSLKIGFTCLFPEGEEGNIIKKLTDISSDNIEIFPYEEKSYIEVDISN